jgi:hypothetical protein
MAGEGRRQIEIVDRLRSRTPRARERRQPAVGDETRRDAGGSLHPGEGEGAGRDQHARRHAGPLGPAESQWLRATARLVGAARPAAKPERHRECTRRDEHHSKGIHVQLSFHCASWWTQSFAIALATTAQTLTVQIRHAAAPCRAST